MPPEFVQRLGKRAGLMSEEQIVLLYKQLSSLADAVFDMWQHDLEKRRVSSSLQSVGAPNTIK